MSKASRLRKRALSASSIKRGKKSSAYRGSRLWHKQGGIKSKCRKTKKLYGRR